jgi:hypothetical protein
MGKLVAFFVLFGLVLGFVIPGHSPASSGNPHRVTTP